MREITVHHSSLSVLNTSCFSTVYDAGWESREGGTGGVSGACGGVKIPPTFSLLWWYSDIPGAASFHNPPPSLSSHQPSAAPESGAELPEQRSGAESRRQLMENMFSPWLLYLNLDLPSIWRRARFWSKCRWRFLCLHVNVLQGKW